MDRSGGMIKTYHKGGGFLESLLIEVLERVKVSG